MIFLKILLLLKLVGVSVRLMLFKCFLSCTGFWKLRVAVASRFRVIRASILSL